MSVWRRVASVLCVCVNGSVCMNSGVCILSTSWILANISLCHAVACKFCQVSIPLCLNCVFVCDYEWMCITERDKSREKLTESHVSFSLRVFFLLFIILCVHVCVHVKYLSCAVYLCLCVILISIKNSCRPCAPLSHSCNKTHSN